VLGFNLQYLNFLNQVHVMLNLQRSCELMIAMRNATKILGSKVGSKVAIYYFAAFVSGLAVMAVELSASRLLAPYFGNSLYVWTNVIGLVMLALALGYFFGGRVSDKYPRPELYFGMIFVTGLWVAMIPVVAPNLLPILLGGFAKLSSAVLFGSFIAIFVLFMVPMFFLGAVVPFTVKMVTDNVKRVGTYAGQVSMISTAGSLAGTFLPAFFLIPIFGTTRTFVIIAVLLLALAAIGLKKWWAVLMLLICSLFFWLVPSVLSNDAVIVTVDSPYGFIFVTEDESGRRELFIDSVFGIQSVYDPSESLTKEYYAYFATLPAFLGVDREAVAVGEEDLLILGHAGGSFTRIYNEFFPEISVTGVEIDPAVTEIGEEYMGLADADFEIVHGDARSYLHFAEENYSLILVDAYNAASIPAHLATTEFFALAKGHLRDGGILALNAAASESEFLQVLKNTLAVNFSVVYEVPVPGSFNTMLFACDSCVAPDGAVAEVPEALTAHMDYVQTSVELVAYKKNLTVFTDDKATLVELLNEEMLIDLLARF